MEDLNNLNIHQNQNKQVNFGIINKPPSFAGRNQDFEGFLTRAELDMKTKTRIIFK